MKPLRRVVLVLIVFLLVALGLSFATTSTDRNQRSHKAIFESQQLLLSCETYRTHPAAEGKYPSSLAELANPPFGGGTFVRDGEAGLLDPWGNPYKYAVVKVAQGDPELYVWTERVVDGKLKLLGAKMSEGKTIVTFGVPE